MDIRAHKALTALTLLVSLTVLPTFAEAQGDRFEETSRTVHSIAPENTGTEGALFLLLPVGAQGVAMGRAMTAIPSQEGAFWNPAGLASVAKSRFLLYRGDHLAGEATSVSALFVNQKVGTLGISYQLLDVGSQDLTDFDGNVLGEVSVRNHQAVISFATEVLERLQAGVNFKVVQFRVGCRGQCTDTQVTATSYALDAGIQAQPFEGIPLRLGAMIAHLGPRLQVINAEQADPLPTRVRISGAYNVLGHFMGEEDMDLWVTLEVEDRWRTPGSPSVYMGSEFSAGSQDIVFVRAGYVMGDIAQTDGAAVGMGFKYQRFDVGVAKSLSDQALGGASEPVHITFGIIF